MSILKVKAYKIEEIIEHPFADKLEICKLKDLAWSCIIKKGVFKQGEIIIYIPIDSILPEELESKIFGEDSKIKLHKHRVQTIKLRKIVSQGLVVKPEQIGITKYKEGDDLTLKLGITKYEPSVEQPSVYGKCNKIKKMYINNNFHKYTDIENIKNHPEVFKEDEEVYISEKLHGTSFRAGWVKNEANTYWKKIKKFFGYFPEYEFIYGSRNVQLNSSYKKYNGFYDENIYAKTVFDYDLYKKLKFGEVLYGEIIGHGIQKNYGYGCREGEIKLFAYDVMIDDRWLDYNEFKYICDSKFIPIVPLIYRGSFNKEMLSFFTKGDSILFPYLNLPREGCVIKSIPEGISPYIGRKVLKSINEDYLLLDDNTDFH